MPTDGAQAPSFWRVVLCVTGYARLPNICGFVNAFTDDLRVVMARSEPAIGVALASLPRLRVAGRFYGDCGGTEKGCLR